MTNPILCYYFSPIRPRGHRSYWDTTNLAAKRDQQFIPPSLDMSNEPEDDIITIQPGTEYLVMTAYGTALKIDWAVWGNGDFEVNVKGVSTFLVFPNPFDSGWQKANQDWQGSGVYGINDEITILTFYLWVRANAVVKIRRKQHFISVVGIPVHF